MVTPISSVALHFDYDVVTARRRARQISSLLGFDEQDQTRIATVASEIARNVLQYAGAGTFQFGVDQNAGEHFLVMTVTDNGPGIANLEDILNGRYRSRTGMGIGLVGARKLMDRFSISSSAERGTAVIMSKALPVSAPELTAERLASIGASLAAQKSENPLTEMQQQNAELLQALAALEERQEQLQRLNQELEDTNRGVLALYAELDENAERLRSADQSKTRYLSDVSHEFRTPLNSILALSRLLGESELGSEERKQLDLIRRSASDLESLVSDLLDTAKIDAGKIEIRPAEFEVVTLFSALRGMLRPLLVNPAVSLVFEDPQGLPPMFSDEGKISQILRNFVSNALKFTEAGEIRITAAPGKSETIVFSVKDTGIGIRRDDQERIFDDFSQIDGPLQRRHRGSGLGLPLTRKLAKLLGGRVGVRSEPGAGSTFWAELPVTLGETRAVSTAVPHVLRVLVIDDDEAARYAIVSFARRPGATIFEATNGLQGVAIAQAEQPDVILLDLMMPGIGGHEVLQRLKSDPATASIPVIVVTSHFINDDEKRQILTRAQAVLYKGDVSREVVGDAIDKALT